MVMGGEGEEEWQAIGWEEKEVIMIKSGEVKVA